MEMKNLFKKIGAGATAFTMVCSLSAVAFADNEAPVEEPSSVEDTVIDEVVPTEAPADVEEPVDEPENVIDETPVDNENYDLAEPAEVIEPAETAGDADVDLAATGITISDADITKFESGARIDITVPFEVAAAVQGDQITALAYDVTSITGANTDTQYQDQVSTPIAHIDQFTYTGNGNLIVSLNAEKYANSTILVKMGGTAIATPAAVLLVVKDIKPGAPVTPDVTYGDVNGDGSVNMSDAGIVMQIFRRLKTDATDEQKIAADVNADGAINMSDAGMIMQYFRRIISSFPADSNPAAANEETLE